jgi:hypothetical protein
MLISTKVFVFSAAADRTCGMAVRLGADIVGGSARTYDAGAGYPARDAGKLVPRLEDALADVLPGLRLVGASARPPFDVAVTAVPDNQHPD